MDRHDHPVEARAHVAAPTLVAALDRVAAPGLVAGLDPVAAPRFRVTFAAVEAFVLVGAVSGAVGLWTGTSVPPVADLEPLGLTDWQLPALWLFATVAVPSALAMSAALARLPRTPEIVMVSSALLLFEVVVQIPFVGPSVLQAVMGLVAVALGALGWIARRDRSWLGERA